jgi:rhomboid protease GluP
MLTATTVRPFWEALVFQRTPLFRERIGGQVAGLIEQGEWWRLASSIGVHVDGLHLLVNLVAILGLGRVLEPWIGARRLVGWFCLGGLLGSLGSHLAGVSVSDGASGGAFALLGALVCLGLDAELGLDSEAAWLLKTPVRLLAGVNLLLPLVLPFLDGIGHLAGFVAGFALVGIHRRWGPVALVLDLVASTMVGVGMLWALGALLL